MLLSAGCRSVDPLRLDTGCACNQLFVRKTGSTSSAALVPPRIWRVNCDEIILLDREGFQDGAHELHLPQLPEPELIDRMTLIGAFGGCLTRVPVVTLVLFAFAIENLDPRTVLLMIHIHTLHVLSSIPSIHLS